MTANAYEDIGSHDAPSAYTETDAIGRECTNCGAVVGERCWFMGMRGKTGLWGCGEKRSNMCLVFGGT